MVVDTAEVAEVVGTMAGADLIRAARAGIIRAAGADLAAADLAAADLAAAALAAVVPEAVTVATDSNNRLIRISNKRIRQSPVGQQSGGSCRMQRNRGKQRREGYLCLVHSFGSRS